MADNKEGKRNAIGISFAGALTLLFVYLKLTNQIGWNWFWVTLPVLIPVYFVAIVLLVIGTFAVMIGILSFFSNKKV